MSIAKPPALRVVLDTNIYFSAFTNPRGSIFRLWSAAVVRRYVLLTSPATMRELAGVLRDKGGWPEPEIIAQLRLLAKVAEIVTPRIVLDAIPDDEADNRVLECAVVGRADLIVSGDHHLRRLRTFQGIGIVRSADFSRTLGFRGFP